MEILELSLELESKSESGREVLLAGNICPPCKSERVGTGVGGTLASECFVKNRKRKQDYSVKIVINNQRDQGRLEEPHPGHATGQEPKFTGNVVHRKRSYCNSKMGR